MPAAKYRHFDVRSQEGRRFIEIWNKANRRGVQAKLMKEFGIPIAAVYRIRKQLGLEDLEGGRHPGRRKLVKRIKRLYWREFSTIMIARMVKMSEENVRNILISERVSMNPQYCTNPLYFPFKNLKKGRLQTLRKIKDMYLSEHKTVAQISRELGVDQCAVARKLKLMGVQLRQNHQPLKGGYPCLWCGRVMENVWQNSGPRKQKYCSGRCKNRSKDYLGMMRGTRKFSANRKAMMEGESSRSFSRICFA